MELIEQIKLENIKSIPKTLFDEVKNSKKYWLIFIILTIICSLTIFNESNYLHPKMEIIIFIIAIILGILCISYYFLKTKQSGDKELYKVAFVLILCFGLICAFMSPICSISDEHEHLVRAEITSRGDFFPQWHDPEGFVVISSIPNFYIENCNNIIFDTEGDTAPIDYNPAMIDSCFQHNPLYGYLPQALGILLAKILDLNVIWMLWLGRIANLLIYALLAAYAVKKTPILKIPTIVIACLPITIVQAGSTSIDGLIFGLGLVTIAYFFYMLKAEEKTLRKKDIIIYSILCLLTGLLKLPLLALIILLPFIPKQNFKEKIPIIYLILPIIALGAIGLLWNEYWATPNLIHSWRGEGMIQNNVNPNEQIHYMISHPLETFIAFGNYPNDVAYTLNENFMFYQQLPHNSGSKIYPSMFISTMITIFASAVCLLYPATEKISKKTKIGTALVFLITIYGIMISFLLTWDGAGILDIHGPYPLFLRYFIPIVLLIPLIFGVPQVEKNQKIDNYIMVLSITFMALTIIAISAISY